MSYKCLFIFVDDNDSERFFNSIIKPKLEEEKYNTVKPWQYAQKPNKKVKKFLRNIKAMHGANYIYTRDIDKAPCVTERKQKIKNKFKNIDKDRVVVIIEEIESCYLAGLDNSASRKLGIRHFRNTDNITKEQFNNLMPKKFNSRVSFMYEILDNYSINIAKRKNRSFSYFIDKYDC